MRSDRIRALKISNYSQEIKKLKIKHEFTSNDNKRRV